MPELALIFATSFLVGLTGAISPGPLLAFNIREAARIGFWAGPAIASGHSLLELLVVLVLATGLRQVLNTTVVVGVIGVLGGLFLLWMGGNMVWEARKARLPAQAEAGGRGSGLNQPLVGGALVSLSNPFWWVWWLTIGASYLLISLPRGAAGLFSFYTGHILADYAWYSLVALAIAGGRKVMGDRAYQWLSVACGAAILVLGIYFAASGVRNLI